MSGSVLQDIVNVKPHPVHRKPPPYCLVSNVGNADAQTSAVGTIEHSVQNTNSSYSFTEMMVRGTLIVRLQTVPFN